jgi:hypothetical protein
MIVFCDLHPLSDDFTLIFSVVITDAKLINMHVVISPKPFADQNGAPMLKGQHNAAF